VQLGVRAPAEPAVKLRARILQIRSAICGVSQAIINVMVKEIVKDSFTIT
jgi:hypothetical protein